MNRLQQLQRAGVAIWLDTLSRHLLDSGAFARLITGHTDRRRLAVGDPWADAGASVPPPGPIRPGHRSGRGGLRDPGAAASEHEAATVEPGHPRGLQLVLTVVCGGGFGGAFGSATDRNGAP